MVNRKTIIIIMVVILIGIILTIFIVNKNMKTEKDNQSNKNTLETQNVLYDEESQLYYLKDSETGEIIETSKYKEDMEFYMRHPDYNPNPLDSRPTDIESYIESYQQSNIISNET